MPCGSEELWSSADAVAAGRARDAVAAGDLEGALVAVDAGADAAQLSATLDAWAAEVRSLINAAEGGQRRSDPCEVLRTALQRVLVQGAGLSGDCHDYYAPANNRIAQVIARRKGQPILLSAVWMLVATRVGVRLDGIGMPGHFVVRTPGGLLADPFAEGQALSVGDCAGIVRQISGGSLPWDDAYLEPVGVRAIVERVLRNLIAAHRRAGDSAGLYRAVRLFAELRPDDPEAALLHGRMAEQLGAVCLARRVYEGIRERWPDRCEADVARRRLDGVMLAEMGLH